MFFINTSEPYNERNHLYMNFSQIILNLIICDKFYWKILIFKVES